MWYIAGRCLRLGQADAVASQPRVPLERGHVCRKCTEAWPWQRNGNRDIKGTWRLADGRSSTTRCSCLELRQMPSRLMRLLDGATVQHIPNNRRQHLKLAAGLPPRLNRPNGCFRCLRPPALGGQHRIHVHTRRLGELGLRRAVWGILLLGNFVWLQRGKSSMFWVPVEFSSLLLPLNSGVNLSGFTRRLMGRPPLAGDPSVIAIRQHDRYSLCSSQRYPQ